MRWWILGLGLLGCGQGDRQEGRAECDPVPITDDCLVWQCYRVINADQVDYHYEWGADGFVACKGYDCAEALREAAKQGCDSDVLGVGCRNDCCDVCEEGSLPCGDACVSDDFECSTPRGCACSVLEACDP